MRKEGGAALVTSLVLLLVLTVIGVSAMQMSRMQERMAGNTRDLNLALQGAEAALRDGETKIEALDLNPITCAAAPCDVFGLNVLPSLHDADQTWWNIHAQEYGVKNVPELTRPAGGELKEEPKAVVEWVGFIRDNLHVDSPGREFYQVTARSTGGTGEAEVVVQSTYARRND